MRRSLAVALTLAATLACGAAGSTAGSGSGGASGAAVPSNVPQTVGSLPAGASGARINAIAAVIARTSNSNDSFVDFRDTSDFVSGGPQRELQMSCDSTMCHFQVLCDNKAPLTCDQIGPKLEALGLSRNPQAPRVYGMDRAGSAADFARLTETVFLTVLGASPGYRLSWHSGAQTQEVPVQP